jgi:hypothetical protein
MHGQPIKICNAKQARQIYQHKKIKIKLYKNNAAIWYNKTCWIKQLIPPYINIRINGNNPRCQRTKNAAIRYKVTIPAAAYIQLRRRPPEDEQDNARNM